MKPPFYPKQPAHLWEHFYQFSQIPRPSKHDAAVRQYVIDNAEQSGCTWRTDDVGNLVITVPATAGMEKRPTVIVQNHLDMVTVKTEDKTHDFLNDPLDLQVVDGWLLADRTTLGADNGVGCAAAMALMTDASIVRPALELLFTVDEETGLGGALNLDASLLTGRYLLNLDTEDWNELYVGCAGGGGWEFSDTLTLSDPEPSMECWQLALKGLGGGHSGLQIHEQLGNSIKLLGELVVHVKGLRLISFDAGVAHNVIPREGTVCFLCEPGEGARLAALLPERRAQCLEYLPTADAGLEVTLEPAEAAPSISDQDSERVLDLLAIMPHGAQAYSFAQPADLVDLSANLAVVRLREGDFLLESSFRFFNEAQSVPLQNSILALARSFNFTVCARQGYPGWDPDFDSALLARASAAHERLYGYEPAIKAIHAGLECGILKGKKPDLDILSFGPTIRGAHSPTERLDISTVQPFWEFLTALLREMK